MIYLLHFDTPFKHAAHYCGYTEDLDARLSAHAAGTGARLMEVIKAAGIGWTLARTWQGGRGRERQLKRQGGASRRCPICKGDEACLSSASTPSAETASYTPISASTPTAPSWYGSDSDLPF